MKPPKSKLFIKFSISIAIVLILTLTISGYFLVKFQENIIISEKNKSWEHFVKYLSQTSAVNLYRYDYFALDESTKLLQRNEKNDSEILSIRIVDNDGKKNNPSGIEISDIKVPEKYRLIKEALCIYKTYMSEKEYHLGKVIVVCSLESVYSEVRSIQMVYIFIIVLLIIIILVALMVTIRVNVTAPLNKLKWQIEEFENGQIVEVFEKKDGDEIAQLTYTFYSMSLKLKISFDLINKQLNEIKEISNEREDLLREVNIKNNELNELNQELENRVEERTLELKNSIEKLIDAQNLLVQTEKMAALGGLVAGVAHEINTPIGVCLTAASYMSDKTKEFEKAYLEENIQKEDLDDFLVVAKDTTQIIMKNIERANELIYSFKQVAVDQTNEAKRMFNIKVYIETILQSLYPKWKKTKHKIELLCEENIELFSYPGAFHQIFSNLIMNSLIHGFEGIEAGIIKIKIEEQDSKIVLTYIDNGRGMSNENLEKIYEPFFTTKRGQGGSGLGMNIVYNIVSQKLNGSITARSEIGKGICFEIHIPKK